MVKRYRVANASSNQASAGGQASAGASAREGTQAGDGNREVSLVEMNHTNRLLYCVC